MDPLKNLVDKVTDYQKEHEEFYDERLAKYDGEKEKWATAIDRAAYDLVGQDNIAIGSTDSSRDIGGTIGPNDFPRAAGTHYVDGLSALANDDSQIQEFLEEYDEHDIGRLVLKLTELRIKLQNETSRELSPDEISRSLEALVEKLTTSEVESGVLRQPLRDTEAVVDMMIQLFGDPAIKEYADALVEETADAAGDKSILSLIDNPQLTTPLWDHQEKALKKWVAAGRRGYVNMATATGKTVLGLAAISQRFDALHPANEKPTLSPSSRASLDGELNVLIVAGKNLLLNQWRDEFETHLNIPKHRTKTSETDRGKAIELSWGTVEFQTSQQLAKTDIFPEYDLVILDEAHRYSKGSSNKGWRRTFENLAQSSQDILAMSGSIDAGWTGDEAIQTVLEEELEEVFSFDLPTARERGVVADFSWNVSYVPAAAGTTVDGLSDVTQTCATYFDSVSGPDLSGFGDKIRQDDIWTLQDLRSFANSSDGRELRDENEEFDTLANAAFSRSTRLWQLEPSLDPIVGLLKTHSGQKTVVLVQSYAFAELLEERLSDAMPDQNVIALIDNQSDPEESITRFNDSENAVLVGPGKLLGTGIDFPDAEVAINVGKGGVNSSLVQRVGRVLRNPSGNKDATFYHLVSIPSDERAILHHEDGRRLLERIVSFKELGERMDENPIFRYEDEGIRDTLENLTRQGASSFEELPYEYSDYVDSEEDAAKLEEICERVTSVGDPVIVSADQAQEAEETSPEDSGETRSQSDNTETESNEQQSPTQNESGDGSMESDSDTDSKETAAYDLDGIDEETIKRVEEVEEREPISDEELIDFWDLDSKINLAIIVAKEADDYFERDHNGDIQTTESWKSLSKPSERETTEREDGEENDTTGSEEGTTEQEAVESEPESEEPSTDPGQEIPSSRDHSTEAIEAVEREFDIDRETAVHLLDLYEANTLVEVDTLVEEWGYDTPASIYRHLNENAGDYTNIVGMGEVKLLEESAERIETAISSPKSSSETPDDDDEQTPDEETNVEGAQLDHYSRLLETDTKYLVDELQRVADHALYPPTEEQVVSESKVAFGSFIYSFGSFAESLRAAGYQIDDDERLVEIDDNKVRPSVVVAAVQILADLLEEPPTLSTLKNLTGIQIDGSGPLGMWLQIVTEAGIDSDLRPDYEDESRKTPDPLDEIPQQGCSAATKRLANFVRESTGEEPDPKDLLDVLKEIDLYELLDSRRDADYPEFEDLGEEDPEGEDRESDNEAGEDSSSQSSGDGDGFEADEEAPERVVLDGRYSPEFELDREDQMLDDILRLAQEFGHPPRPADVARYGRFTPSEITESVGTWDEVLDEAGFDMESAWVDEPDHDSQLLEELRGIDDRLPHRPTIRNIDELSEYSATTYVSRWGSMERAIEAAGLEYDRSDQIGEIVESVAADWEVVHDMSDEQRKLAMREALLTLRQGWEGRGHQLVSDVEVKIPLGSPSYNTIWKKTLEPALQDARERGLVKYDGKTWSWKANR
jgi:superfamily II DNA or RNA helicase